MVTLTFDVVQVAPEIAREALYQRWLSALLCTLAFDLPYHLGKVRGPAILKVISVHRRYHDIIQAPFADGLARILRFHGVGGARLSVRLDTAKTTTTRALVSEDHDGRRRHRILATTPALADVGTSRLLTHRR